MQERKILTTFSKINIGRDQLAVVPQGNSMTFFLHFYAESRDTSFIEEKSLVNILRRIYTLENVFSSDPRQEKYNQKLTFFGIDTDKKM
jgi:myosin-crossreactive antigen